MALSANRRKDPDNDIVWPEEYTGGFGCGEKGDSILRQTRVQKRLVQGLW